MAATYKKLFHMLIDRNMSPAQLQQEAGYSANISTRLRRDYYVSLESVKNMSGPELQGGRYRGVHPRQPERRMMASGGIL